MMELSEQELFRRQSMESLREMRMEGRRVGEECG